MNDEVNLTGLEEAYQKYRKKRAEVQKTKLVTILLWFVCLPIFVLLGNWIYDVFDLYEIDNLFSWIGAMLEVLIVALIATWIPTAFSVAKQSIRRLNYTMSLKLMEQELRNVFGDYSEEDVQYLIFQDDLHSVEAERNQRLAWLDRDNPFLLHRARITNGSSGEEGHVVFDGIAISVPVVGYKWKNVLSGKNGYQSLQKVWGPVFQEQIGYKTQYGLDVIDGTQWLTVGFVGLTIGEQDVPWRNLQKWHENCQKDVALIKRAVDLVYTITPESCKVQ